MVAGSAVCNGPELFSSDAAALPAYLLQCSCGPTISQDFDGTQSPSQWWLATERVAGSTVDTGCDSGLGAQLRGSQTGADGDDILGLESNIHESSPIRTFTPFTEEHTACFCLFNHSFSLSLHCPDSPCPDWTLRSYTIALKASRGLMGERCPNTFRLPGHKKLWGNHQQLYLSWIPFWQHHSSLSYLAVFAAADIHKGKPTFMIVSMFIPKAVVWGTKLHQLNGF